MDKIIRVATNGYGVIGKRVADAVARQEDMQLTGVADVAGTLEDMLGQADVVVVHAQAYRRRLRGWQGALGAGHAPVLKRLLDKAPCALLLVRAPAGSPARLEVGEDIDA